jgi:hypothetical protein
MEGTLDGVAAIAGIQYGGQKYASVGGTAAAQQLYHGLHEEAGRGGPRNRE